MERSDKNEKLSLTACPSPEIAPYIDGELTSRAEADLESHLSVCGICRDELNREKQFVNALNASLSAAPELPVDLTKQIVVKAESGVGGLRGPGERTNAALVFCFLVLILLFTLGASAPKAVSAVAHVAGRSYAVAAFTSHLVFDVTTGLVIVLRAIVSEPSFGVSAVFGGAIVIVVAAFLISRSRKGPHAGQIKSGNFS